MIALRRAAHQVADALALDERGQHAQLAVGALEGPAKVAELQSLSAHLACKAERAAALVQGLAEVKIDGERVGVGLPLALVDQHDDACSRQRARRAGGTTAGAGAGAGAGTADGGAVGPRAGAALPTPLFFRVRGATSGESGGKLRVLVAVVVALALAVAVIVIF